uniref:Odorant receptor n=1 Tax=Dendroctonus ponderosae TaxID=77166 RepID=R9PSL6_DENPD
MGGSGEFSSNILNLGISALHLCATNRVSRWFLIKNEFEVILANLRKINTDFSLFDYQSHQSGFKMDANEPEIHNEEYIGQMAWRNLNCTQATGFKLRYADDTASSAISNAIIKYKTTKLLETKRYCLGIFLTFLINVALNISISYTINYGNPLYEKWNPLLNKTSVYRDYPYPLLYPFDTSVSDGHYLLGFFYQPYAFFCLMCAFFCIEYLCVGTIIHLTTHVNILGYAFSYVDENIDPMLDYSKVIMLKEKRIIKLSGELKEIYNCAKELNAVFSGQLLMQEFLMSTVMCCCVYRVTTNISTAEIGYLSTMVAVCVAEMFTVSWFNQCFTLELFKIQQRIYELEWIDYPPKLRRVLLFLMCRVQKPFNFTMGFGFPLDVNVFLSMIKTSYSFYTLITRSGSKFSNEDV